MNIYEPGAEFDTLDEAMDSLASNDGRGFVSRGGQTSYVVNTPNQLKNDEIDDILTARGKTYGVFMNQAKCAQILKITLTEALGDRPLAVDMSEALDMICSKMARIVNGDPTYLDNWVDIAGYAKLVVDRLKETEEDCMVAAKAAKEEYDNNTQHPQQTQS